MEFEILDVEFKHISEETDSDYMWYVINNSEQPITLSITRKNTEYELKPRQSTTFEWLPGFSNLILKPENSNELILEW